MSRTVYSYKYKVGDYIKVYRYRYGKTCPTSARVLSRHAVNRIPGIGRWKEAGYKVIMEWVDNTGRKCYSREMISQRRVIGYDLIGQIKAIKNDKV